MLTSERQKHICAKYSTKNAEGKVRCSECPLVISYAWSMCRANAHYDRHLREWDFDNIDALITSTKPDNDEAVYKEGT